MENYLKAVMVSVVSALVLRFLTLSMFIPTFLSAFLVSIVAIVLFRINDLKEALIVALTSYLFSSALIGTYVYGLLYSMGLNSITFQFGLMDLIDNLLTPITSVFAAMIGIYFTSDSRSKLSLEQTG